MTGTNPVPTNDEQAPTDELPDGFVLVGTITGTHGYDGRVRVESATSNPDRFARGAHLWLDGVERTVERSGSGPGGVVLVKLSGVGSREHARELVGNTLAVPEAEVAAAEPGTYYHFQLLEMRVEQADGAYLGTLTEVLETGSNDVYVVTGESDEWLLPALADVILEVDVPGKRMRVAIPDGLEPRPLTPPKPKRPPRRRRRPRRPAPPQG